MRFNEKQFNRILSNATNYLSDDVLMFSFDNGYLFLEVEFDIQKEIFNREVYYIGNYEIQLTSEQDIELQRVLKDICKEKRMELKRLKRGFFA